MNDSLQAPIDYYKLFYPDYTPESLTKAVEVVLEKQKTLDAITLDYYMRSKELRGLGYGRKIERY